jgi:hypothetical protein
MPTKKWVNWSQVKHPLPYNFNPKFPQKICSKPIPQHLVDRVNRAVKLIEKYDTTRVTAKERDDRELEVANSLVWVDFWKEYERKKPSPSVERERILERAGALRAVAGVLSDEMCHLNGDDAAAFAKSIALVRKHADKWRFWADVWSNACKQKTTKRSEAKKMASNAAYYLLKLHLKKRPGVTLQGDWQELARILYGAIVDIGYLQRQRSLELWSRGPVAKREREEAQAWLESQRK